MTLVTEPMDGASLVVDTIKLNDLRSHSGNRLMSPESRPFIHGIASIPGIQWPISDSFPFASRYEGLVATASCQKAGGVNSDKLIDSFGWSFLHVERGGPFNSIKSLPRSTCRTSTTRSSDCPSGPQPPRAVVGR